MVPNAALEPQLTPSPRTSMAEFFRATTANVSAIGFPKRKKEKRKLRSEKKVMYSAEFRVFIYWYWTCKVVVLL